ncbi:MAG: NAD-dependent protein deacylase [Treponema sp.]|nr:NAD-dependent protein deacylase [Treponema sp.]MBP5752544.1 NAD-dependent protein deacylase [Treponema sp.]
MSATQEQIDTLQSYVSESSSIVFFGGAGVSTESGIPDFRSVDGLYNQKWDYPPEEILSRGFFHSNPAEFYRFYREKILVKGILPNAAHKKLAEMEAKGKLKAVITQNIDGLHQAAGSRNVLELHGSVLRNHCVKCGAFYDGDYVIDHKDEDGIARCSKDSCGGIIKPDVVLYGENLDEDVISRTIKALQEADMLIIGGTSLTVYPAAGFIRAFSGDRLVLINRDATPNDGMADLVIHDSIGKVLDQIIV